MMQRRSFRCVALAVVVLGSLLAWPAPGQAAGFDVRRRAELVPGVEVRGLSGDGLSLDVGRVAAGAPVRVEAIAAGAVAGGVETTSAVCRRVGGIVCVNADFTECRTCTTAFGGIVHDRVLQRSPVGNHPQLSLGPPGPSAGNLGWGASLEATVTYLDPSPSLLPGVLPPPAPTERVERASLGVDAVNRRRGANQVVLYTPPWSSTTGTRGGDEAILGSGPLVAGTDVPVDPRAFRAGAGSSPIPGDGAVLSADGAGAARLRAFWAKAADPTAARRTVVVRPRLDRPVEESVGGFPPVLTNGRTVIAGDRNPFVTSRNPRTLVGWNRSGDLLLVTVDGRQPGHSRGVSLVEGADILRQLGATSGFNLDGGGSSTFVSLPPGGRSPQVLNRPSDGNERRVTTILAVVPNNPGSVRPAAAGAPPPPPPPPAPPGPPPADEASTDGLPVGPAAPPAPTTTPTAPPTTAAPTTTAPPPPVPETVPPEPVDVQVAAPALPPATPGRPSTWFPGGVAVLALAATSAATLRTARRSRRS